MKFQRDEMKYDGLWKVSLDTGEQWVFTKLQREVFSLELKIFVRKRLNTFYDLKKMWRLNNNSNNNSNNNKIV